MTPAEARPDKTAVDRALKLQAGSVLAREVEHLRASVARVRHAANLTFEDPTVAPASAATAERILRALDGGG